MSKSKSEWQRRDRSNFKAKHGYSRTAFYRAGGKRQAVLARDGARCVSCGMTDAKHRAKWGRPITIDHKDRNLKNNAMSNLQTLCLSCHGRKDGQQDSPVAANKAIILKMRADGATMQAIADRFKFSNSIIHRWLHRWGAA